jgi:hypothetical protein
LITRTRTVVTSPLRWLTAEAGHDVESKPNSVAGLDGVLYRTEFFGPDGNRDSSLSALLIGRAIARRF